MSVNTRVNGRSALRQAGGLIRSLWPDRRGANAVEYALIMALVAVFIIGAVILMATEIANLYSSMAS